MAELATLARPYAEALFKSISISEAQSTATQLSELAQVAGDEGLRAFADNPRSSVDQIVGLITSATKTELGSRAKNLLRVIVENDRLSALPEISTQFQALVNAQSGSSDATIFSAYPIAVGELADVVATLEKRFGRKLKPTVVVAPELIGGIRAVVGDEVLDTSVKARLEQMKLALTA